MNLNLEGILKEAFGVDKDKQEDLSHPGIPYTFENTLEWATGQQPKKKPNQLVADTPLAKANPQISSATEAHLEEPLLSPIDLIGPGTVKGIATIGKTAVKEAERQLATGYGILGRLAQDAKTFVVDHPDDARLAEYIAYKKAGASENQAYKKFQIYQGKDGKYRQNKYDGYNTILPEFTNNVYTNFIDTITKKDINQEMVIHESTLKDVLDSPYLFKDHSYLENVPVKVNIIPRLKHSNTDRLDAAISWPGRYAAEEYHAHGFLVDTSKFTIEVDLPKDYFDHVDKEEVFLKEFKGTLHHEISHLIQFEKGFSLGSSPSKQRAVLTRSQMSELHSLLDQGLGPKGALDHWIDLQNRIYLNTYGEGEARVMDTLSRVSENFWKNAHPHDLMQKDLEHYSKMLGDPMIGMNYVGARSPYERALQEWGGEEAYAKEIAKLEERIHGKKGIMGFVKDIIGIGNVSKIPEKNNKIYETTIESSDPYGNPTLIPISFRAKSKEDFIKRVEDKLGITFSDAQEVSVAGQARKTRKTPRQDTGGDTVAPDNAPSYIPKYGKRGQEII